LREALREARIEQTERTGVVVDLRDAEIARLELLNEALDPVFADISEEIELFDRGVSHGETPRLWIDITAHVVMARDKRTYRLLQDTRFGRKVLAETAEIAEMVKAVTRYAARRMIERERALAGDQAAIDRPAAKLRRRPGSAWLVGVFLLGMGIGILFLFIAAAYIAALTLPVR
jgi:hypothetical protein